MKLRYILTSLLACLALAVGCVQEELPGLSEIEVTPSYFSFEVDGGSKEVTVTTALDWKVTDAPEWLTVTPASGKGNGKFTVNVAASTDTLARTAQLKVAAGGESQLVTVNQAAFIPDFPEFKGGDYWIVFDGGAAMPLSSAYGYLYTAPVNTDEAGKITSTAQNIFTFTAVEGGFTIQDPSKQYYCMQGTYDSFNVYAELPETGGVWTVKQVGSTDFQIVNVANGKMIQYDPSYSSAGAYSNERGLLANLVKVEVIPEPEPLGDATSIKDASEIEPEIIVEGIVTASSTKGVILTDETASLLVYGINSEVKVGDALKVQGNLSSYNKGYQLANPYQYEIASSDNEITYPEAVELTAATAANVVKPAVFLAQYASVKGIAAVDSYNNAIVTIGDYKVKTYYSHDSYADYADKAVELKGYVVAYKESSMEMSLIVTSVEELENWEPEVEVEGKALPFEETFAAGQGEFTVEGDEIWSAASYGSDAYMKASGFIDGAKTDSEGMLVSPVIDLTAETAAYLSFDHTGKYFGDMLSEATVWAKKFEDTEWTELSIPTYMTGNDYTFVNSGDIDLKDFLGSNMQFAFKYVSTTAAAGTWEVMNVKVLKEAAPYMPTPSNNGPFANGKYYIVAGDKAASALAEDKTYGYLPSVDFAAVTENEQFTFQYYEELMGYTIQDVYGRYLYNGVKDSGDPYFSFNLSKELPGTEEEFGFYIWVIDEFSETELDIYNTATLLSMSVSAQYGSWELADASAEDFANAMPTLVSTTETPGEGGGNDDTFEGDGLTAETAYTVADAIAYYNAGMDVTAKVWVKGTIIGSYQNNALLEGAEGASATNIAIGTAEAHLPVQLPKGDVRTGLNLVDNPTVLGKTVALYCTIEKYFSVAGLKNAEAFVLE